MLLTSCLQCGVVLVVVVNNDCYLRLLFNATGVSFQLFFKTRIEYLEKILFYYKKTQQFVLI